MSGKAFRLAAVIAGVAISLFFLVLTFRGLDWRGVLETMRDAHVVWLAPAVAALVAAYTIRVERWRRMLHAFGIRAPFSTLAAPLVGSLALNNVLPLRAGDVVRTFAFGDRLKARASAVAATVIVERILDLWTLCLFVCLGAFQFGAGSDLILATAIAGAGISLVLGLCLVFAGAARRLALFLLRRGLARFVPVRIVRFGLRLLTSIGIVSRGRIAMLIALSCCAWLLEGGVLWCALQALGAASSSIAAWLALALGNLATLLPGSPGHVGTFDYFAMQGFIAGGVGAEDAAGAALLSHCLIWVCVTFVGFALLALRPQQRVSAGAASG